MLRVLVIYRPSPTEECQCSGTLEKTSDIRIFEKPFSAVPLCLPPLYQL